MKCRQCGAAMTLEDEYCPYCGALNPGARKHIEDMKRYRADYNATKESVLKSAERQKRSHAEWIIICILAVLNIGLIAVRVNRWELKEWLFRKQVWLQQEEIAAELDRYEEDGDFYAAGRTETMDHLYDAGKLKEYSRSVYMADYCADFFDSLFYLNSGISEYRSPENCIESMGAALSRFYEVYKRKDLPYGQEMYGKHLPFMENMKQKMEAVLTAQFGFTEEELAGLSELDRYEIEKLLGERMQLNEERE